MDDLYAKFVAYITKELLKKNYFLRLVDEKELVENRVRMSGYFSEDNKELKIATQISPSEWIPVLSHEFCHFIQWRDKTPANQALKIKYRDTTMDANYMFWSWIEKEKEYPKKYVLEAFKKTRDMELECEKMSIKLMKKFKLPINFATETKKANAYILLFKHMFEKRSPRNGVGLVPELYGRLSSRFSYDYENPPKSFYVKLDKLRKLG